MQRDEVIGRAAAPTIEVARNVAAGQLDTPTPCKHYSVRQLVNHLLFWAPPLAGAARKEVVPPPGCQRPAGRSHRWRLVREAGGGPRPARHRVERPGRLAGRDTPGQPRRGARGDDRRHGVHRAGHPRLGPGPRDRPQARVGRGGGRFRLPRARRHRRAGQGDGPVRAPGRGARDRLGAGSRPRPQRPRPAGPDTRPGFHDVGEGVSEFRTSFTAVSGHRSHLRTRGGRWGWRSWA